MVLLYMSLDRADFRLHLLPCHPTRGLYDIHPPSTPIFPRSLQLYADKGLLEKMLHPVRTSEDIQLLVKVAGNRG